MYSTDYFKISNEDNIELMARYEDNHFDLAIVDPPYGAGQGYNFRFKEDDLYQNVAPNINYWEELFRVSKAQFVWGGNYFTNHLPVSRGWVCWDKCQTESGYFSHFELAWTSIDKVAKFVRVANAGFNHGDKRRGELKTIHPTQKPVALYEWLLKNYAKEGDKILDTHLGSGSIAIAVDRMNKIEGMNLTLTACELDTDYYNDAIKRIKNQTAQQTIAL